MAYTKDIGQNTNDSHQTSPAYCLTFIRWSNRDTFNYALDNLAVRKPLTVINDAITVTASNSKSGITPQMSALLKGGDINYATAIAPGDFVFVNMVNDRTKVWQGTKNDNTLRNRSLGLKPINEYNDGFKGLYKIQTVRKELYVDPATGVKQLGYRVHAFGFTEFNTDIYYNPQITNELKGRYSLFAAEFDSFWGTLTSSKKSYGIDELMKLLIKTLIGQGTKKTDTRLPPSPNRHFRVPSSVGKLLGVPGARYAVDIYNFIFGIWQASNSKAANTKQGFNPKIVKDGASTNFFKTSKSLDGSRVLAAEYWNQVKVWNIIGQYLNNTVNEMYTTYRVSPLSNRIIPTFVARQKTFSSLHFRNGKDLGKSKSKERAVVKDISRHLEMPRWRLAPEMITKLDLGRDEAARINFVQIYTRTVSEDNNRNLARQTGKGNFVTDVEDIERHGLHPYIATANFDFPGKNTKEESSDKSKQWAHLIADWLIGGHLREAGIIECIGIEQPISVGDKLEFNDVVYEIEEVSHTMSIDKNGRKIFRTTLRVSFGMDTRSSKTKPVYPEMDHTDGYTYQKEDFDIGEAILPGIGDTQDIGGRTLGEETSETRQASFTLNAKKKKQNTEKGSRENRKITITKEEKGGNKVKKPSGDNFG
jgi:hypothetical protein